ncbi:HAMP domain-containing protein, partial [Vibrio sp. M60_M31a]
MLKASLNRIENGDLTLTTGIKSKNEFGELSNSIDQMINTLKQLGGIGNKVGIPLKRRTKNAKAFHD